MMEVVHVFACELETMFLAVSLLDLFLANFKEVFPKEKLHLACTTCIYMASKMEDIMPISVQNIVNKILHKKYDK